MKLYALDTSVATNWRGQPMRRRRATRRVTPLAAIEYMQPRSRRSEQTVRAVEVERESLGIGQRDAGVVVEEAYERIDGRRGRVVVDHDVTERADASARCGEDGIAADDLGDARSCRQRHG